MRRMFAVPGRRREFFRILQQRRDKTLLPLHGERDHGISMMKRGQGLSLLMRRRTGWDEQYLLQIVALLGRAGDGNVSAMDRVEGTSEERNVHSDPSFEFQLSSFKCKRETLREPVAHVQAVC